MQSSTSYFAYGSNLYPNRLEQRVGSCRIVGVARLSAFRLSFHKRGKDGSAKCDAYKTGDDRHSVYGVVYVLSDNQLAILNDIEGLGAGYELETSQVQIIQSAQLINAHLYVTQNAYIDVSLAPYSWYLDFVLYGARIQGLPSAYISQLEKTKVISDPNKQRQSSNQKILSGGLSS